MKCRETIIVVSEDGKRAVGKSFVVNEGEKIEKGALAMTAEEIKSLDAKLDKVIEDYTSDCEKDAKTFDKEVERHAERTERLRLKVKKFTAKSESLQKKIEFWKLAGTYAVLTLSILGFIGGAIIAITEVLKHYGPTESVIETAVAVLGYLVSGAVLCLILGWLTKVITNGKINHYKELLARNEELLAELDSEQTFSSQEAEKYSKMRTEKSKKAHMMRGLR